MIVMVVLFTLPATSTTDCRECPHATIGDLRVGAVSEKKDATCNTPPESPELDPLSRNTA
jgi:hypothetical protein